MSEHKWKIVDDKAYEDYIHKLLNDPEFMAVAEKLGIVKKRK